MFSSVKKIHFVGIGGIGMSGIAEILINQGFQVSGSDMAQSENTDYLSTLGAKIFIGHKTENIESSEVVVYSSAVNPDINPETLEATARNLPLLRRAEMLAEVSRLNYCLAVAGTHGKTTSTSIVGLALIKAGFDPTVIVGGRLKSFGNTNARLGNGEWTIVEADEYDRSFLQLLPTIAIINNVEAEHLDIYKDYNDIKKSFIEFANKVPFYGFVAIGLDDPGAKDILSEIKKKTVSFGISRNCDVRADDIKFFGRMSSCTVSYKGNKLGEMRVNVPGVHNIKNALASLTVCLEIGIPFETAVAAIEEFTGVNRRFEILGEKNNIIYVDDYAHHPTEIQATIQAARKGWNKRIVAVFQPHTFTRTRDFYKDFARSFDDADILIVLDIYPAREKPIEGISSKLVVDSAIQFGHKNVIYCPAINDAELKLSELLQSGDMLIGLGAGDVWKLTKKMYNS